jgi:hypothetical protein
MITAARMPADMTFSVSRTELLLKSRHFPEDRALAKFPYQVDSRGVFAPLKGFTEAMKIELPDVTWANADCLTSLCTEIGFDSLRDVISKSVSGDESLEGIPVHQLENVRTFFAELDFAIPMSDNCFKIVATRRQWMAIIQNRCSG